MSQPIVTEWARTPRVWKALQDVILPRIAQPHIWSGACGTGEEAYTAATLAVKFNGTVLGTDVRPDLIAVAKEGRYGGRLIGQHIRDAAKFQVLDLQVGKVPDCDVALLRNVWRHLRSETRPALLIALRDVIPPHGRLILGGADFYPTLKHVLSQSEGDILATLRDHFIEAEHELIWKPK